MKAVNTLPFLLIIGLIALASCRTAFVPTSGSGMLIRISQIEIYADSLTAYNAILKEEAAASVRLEPGVIAIFPMYEQKDSTQIRILEIYANTEAYQSHIKSPYFQHYKTSTLNMVKSLQLVDMTALDQQTMSRQFKKLKK
jgi:quinol monooxygenase YgiN